ILIDTQTQIGKVASMLNTADYLIQATWCPLPRTQQISGTIFDGNIVNMEHIAATGAAIQNILLTATALGHENYWSSGGPLRESSIYTLMNIPKIEILLGSLFIFPSENETNDEVQFLASKRRDKRGKLIDSYRLVKF
ncbi:MAG: hypothetical protein ACWIPH_10560, partial [Ostreibacterium sp.]